MNRTMAISPIRTAVFHLGENLTEFIVNSVDSALVKERSVLAITSKIVSLAESRTVKQNSIEKKALIKREADYDLGEIGHGVNLTIKNNLLLPAAGIDESNSEHGDYILYPLDPFASAENLRKSLQHKWGLKEFGVIITDSRTGPLRLGIVGVSVAFSGFHPVRNMVGKEDIFGRPLKMTKINLVDSLSAAAVVMMGEADERCPLAMINNASVEFTDNFRRSDLEVSVTEDIYSPLYSHLIKSKN
ncbi:MAG: coenzyme F420-0:L-glutamate ligase [Bdellovibrio sp.]